MFRNVAFAIAAIGLIGSASAALAAPNVHQTQISGQTLRQRAAVQDFSTSGNTANPREERPIVHHGNPWGNGSRGD